MDGQASHQCWEDLVKLFEVLQSIEHQGFLSCLPSLALIFTKLFTKQSEVARCKHHLEDSMTEGHLLGLLGTLEHLSAYSVLVLELDLYGVAAMTFSLKKKSPITDLVAESKDAIHLPVVLAGAECV